jgi:hypothetical protein
MIYTSEGTELFDYNICTLTQAPAITTTLPASPSYAHRFIPASSGGGHLVAATSEIIKLDNSGIVVKTCTAGALGDTSTSPLLFAANLDPDGTSAWTGDYITGQFFKFNFSTCAVLISGTASSFATFSGPFGGVAVFGELTSTCPPHCVTGAREFSAPATMVTAIAFVAFAFLIRARKSTFLKAT